MKVVNTGDSEHTESKITTAYGGQRKRLRKTQSSVGAAFGIPTRIAPGEPGWLKVRGGVCKTLRCASSRTRNEIDIQNRMT